MPETYSHEQYLALAQQVAEAQAIVTRKDRVIDYLKKSLAEKEAKLADMQVTQDDLVAHGTRLEDTLAGLALPTR